VVLTLLVAVDNFITFNNIKNGISIHIRLTDFATDKNRTDIILAPYEKWYKFIDSFPRNTPVFLATDNADTQNTFMSKYLNIVVWKK